MYSFWLAKRLAADAEWMEKTQKAKERRDKSLSMNRGALVSNYKNRLEKWIEIEADKETEEQLYKPGWRRNTHYRSSSEWLDPYDPKNTVAHYQFRDEPDKTKHLGESWVSANKLITAKERCENAQKDWKAVKQPPFEDKECYPLHGLRVQDWVYTRLREKSKEKGGAMRYGLQTEPARVNKSIEDRGGFLNDGQPYDATPFQFRDNEPHKHVGGAFSRTFRPRGVSRKYETIAYVPNRTWQAGKQDAFLGEGVFYHKVQFQPRDAKKSEVLRPRIRGGEQGKLYESTVQTEKFYENERPGAANLPPVYTTVPPSTYFKAANEIMDGTFDKDKVMPAAKRKGETYVPEPGDMKELSRIAISHMK